MNKILAILLILATSCNELRVDDVISGPKDEDDTTEPLTASRPGPNPDLFNAPFYECLQERYVSTTGNDGNDGLTTLTAWRNLQKADDEALAPGTCVNVAPGTYSMGTLYLTNGGTTASPTGYVVYRSTVLSGAILDANANMDQLISVQANYLVLDGFDIDGHSNRARNSCIDSWSGNGGHHIWILNNKIHNCGLSGVQLDGREYLYIWHNEVYANSSSYFYSLNGSGISIYEPEVIAAYTPTQMDTELGEYKIQIMYNIARNNFNRQSSNTNTDGNGIILDDWRHTQIAPHVVYPGKGLVYGNLTYGNGGKGIHSNYSANVVIANNTAYGNNFDTHNTGQWRGDITVQNGSANTVINNIAWTITGAGALAFNSPFAGKDAFAADNVWSNNIAFGAATDLDAPDIFPAGDNQTLTNPLLVNAPGSDFKLDTASPALGYGMNLSGLPETYFDVGACSSLLSSCP